MTASTMHTEPAMSQTMKARNTLRLAHSQPMPKHRPVSTRLAIVLASFLIVPVIVLLAELVRGWVS